MWKILVHILSIEAINCETDIFESMTQNIDFGS